MIGIFWAIFTAHLLPVSQKESIFAGFGQAAVPWWEDQSTVQDKFKGDISVKTIHYDVYSFNSTLDSHTREGKSNA